jgi:DNA-binding transcriptional regulator LsrR (DeoR family)
MPRTRKPVDQHATTVLLRVAELFLGDEKLNAAEIAKRVNDELHPDPPLTRETVYPKLSRAREEGIIELVPPIDAELTKRLQEEFGLNPEHVRVVATPGARSSSLVADTAADMAFELLGDLQKSRPGKPITMGLGPGRASLDFSRALGALLRNSPLSIRLRLVSITAGAPSDIPQFAPTSFFNLFPTSQAAGAWPDAGDVKQEQLPDRVGFFSQSIARAGEMQAIRDSHLFKVVAQERNRIDLIVSSMGDPIDEHDLLRRSLEEHGVDTQELLDQGWVGNFQYRPYTAHGPVIEPHQEYRAVTLYELEDFRRLAHEQGKYILLIARQCGICNRTRAEALRPLLTEPGLRVFNRLCLDVATAHELLSPAAKPPAPRLVAADPTPPEAKAQGSAGRRRRAK